ncbi:hypothetical protein [Pseudoalteromonas sp.]|uniref:hypothetical protein n=1 Tax=Pseudoalteromonas sp. TaxID=53249 RepID=UPI003003821B
MAIVSCPSCNKSISDKHKQCPHCDSNVAQLDDEQRQQLAREKRIQKQQMFMNHSFFALIIFLAGFFCLYFLNPEPETPNWYACAAAIAIGCIWYLINRVILVMLKKKK